MEPSPKENSLKLIESRRLRFRFMRHDAWENALFVHWPVDPEELRKQLPKRLEPDLMDGSAWIGLVLLTERGVSVSPNLGRMVAPKIDHFGANIRTYVRCNGVPGIFFFSLECSSFCASAGARLAGIPYFPASMSRTVDINCPIRLNSEELSVNEDGAAHASTKAERKLSDGVPDFVFGFSSYRRWPFGRAEVSARWRLQSAGEAASDMESKYLKRARWFVERYSVYAAWPMGNGPVLLRGDVQHPSWPLQSASLEKLDAGSLFTSAGFPQLAGAATFEGVDNSHLTAPHVCFSRGVGPVDFWMMEPV